MKDRTATILATGFGTGYIPVAPGTAGSILACILYWLWLRHLETITYTITVFTFIFLAIWAAGLECRRLKRNDPKSVVIDEMVGMFVTMLFQRASIVNLAIGFAAFRLFDISKIPPVNLVERHMRGGAGIVMDDVTAGIYANIIVRLAAILIN